MTMADTLKDFGSRVRERREQEGWTQETLAQKVGISRTYLSKIEQGRATNLSLRLAEELNTTLGLEVAVQADESVPVDPTLRAFADRHGLPAGDVQMLARLEYRGRRPQNDEQWRFLYNLIKTTLQNDD